MHFGQSKLTTHSVQTANGIAGLFQSSRVPGWLWGLLLVGAVIIAYQPVWHAGFIWDDDTFLFNNPLIKQANGLYQFWFTTKAPDYFPLTSTTLWLEWRLWGTNPLGYHIVNVLLHALSAVLIWRVFVHLKNSRSVAGGGLVCGSSGQCGIGGVDHRAQEHAGHAVLCHESSFLPAI